MELTRTQETNRQNEASKLPETRENAGRSLLVLYLTGWKIGSRFFQTKYGRVK